MVAIMGSSGAGKSSFMNIISQRTTVGVIGGEVALICDSMRAKSPKDVISYVLQVCSLCSFCTCRGPVRTSPRAVVFLYNCSRLAACCGCASWLAGGLSGAVLGCLGHGMAAHVAQDDRLMTTQTVREAL